jgi:hypothetical protein
MFGTDPATQREAEEAGKQATAVPSGTSTGCGAGCGGEGNAKRPEAAAATPSRCGGCAPPAGGPARALRHARKGVGTAVVLLLALAALKTAVARSRTA